jgi:hypothetical protein
MEQDGSEKKINPLAIFIGLALVSLLVLAGLTKDRWYKSEPAAVAEAPVAPAQTAEPAAEAMAPAPTAETTPATGVAAAPAAEQPAEPVAGQQVAAAPAEPEVAVTAQSAAAEAPGFDTVRIEKTGEAVIAGRAVAGSEVVIKLNGQPIGSATSNQDGNFVVVPEQPLPAGTGALTLEIKPAGSAAFMPAGETVAVAVPEGEQQQAMVAVVSQDQPTQVLQAPEETAAPAATETAAVQPEAADTAAAQPEASAPAEAPATPATMVSLDAVDYDSQGNIMFSGRGTAGNAVRLYVDNAPVGKSQTGADGRWSFVGAAQIAPGNHTLRVDEIDAAGAVASRVELPFFREEVAKVAAAEPEAPAAAPEAQPAAPAAGATAETQVAAATVEAMPKLGRVVIQPGNNLWRISQVIYGSGVKYTVIYEANREFIRDPDLIYPGQIFTTPDVVPPEKIDPRRRAPLAPGEGEAAAQ